MRPHATNLFPLSRSRINRRVATAAVRGLLLLCLACVLSCGCGPSKNYDTYFMPSVQFTKIPPSARGGRERVGTVAGHVSGARPGQRVVIYAKSGPWWVQPWPDQALLSIQSDLSWSTETHLGYEYAALLVDSDYHPPPTMDQNPTAGGSVVAVTIVKGLGSLPDLPTQPLRFSGYDWTVYNESAVRGGLNNLYDADHVSTDSTGALHLRISKKSGKWVCAHLALTRSLGYGTYIFVVRDTSHLEPAAVLSMHTYDLWGGEQHYREMDFEIGRWGDAGSKNNAQYGVQPFYIPGNMAQFNEPAGTLTHTLHWESGRASFKTVRGSSLTPRSAPVYQYTFTSGVPSPGQELLEFMFYPVASDQTPLQNDSEVVVEKFVYLP